MNSRTYEVGRSRVTLRFGDLTTSSAEVLVSSDDYLLSMGGGVSAALRLAGGPRLAADASKMVPAKAGEVIVSTAGDLPARYICHAVTIGPELLELAPDALVRQTTQSVLRLLPSLRCRSVAFPAIGAGVAAIPYETVATQMAGAVVEFLLDTDETYEVELYLMDRSGRMGRDDFFMFFESFAARTLGLSSSADPSRRSLEPPRATTAAMDPEQRTEAQRRHEVYLMLRHLDMRRNQTEAELLSALQGKCRDRVTSLAQLRRQLEEVQALRLGYEAELARSESTSERVLPNSVFVSSTSTDLKPYREAVRSVIKTMQLRFVGMEEFAPTAQAPADLIRRKVNEAHTYLGILGMRYGYVDPGTSLSMTELEYHQAIASKKPMCMFVMDQSASIRANMVEDDPARYAKLLNFRSRVLKDHTCGLFTDPDDLAEKATAALKENLKGMGSR